LKYNWLRIKRYWTQTLIIELKIQKEYDMSLSSFLETLKTDAIKFENVVIKDEQAVVAWLEKAVGKTNVDNAVNTIESILETDVGKLTKKFVLVAEDVLGSGAGSAKASLVLQWVSMAASALGISAPANLINLALNAAAAFIGSKATSVVQQVVQPVK
jgi:hypothetical protein